MLTSTTFEISGNRTVRCLGVVRGPMVGAAEVLCYGTAVVIERA
jgi:uncharacterized protein YbjQ (UPF0145 family)